MIPLCGFSLLHAGVIKTLKESTQVVANSNTGLGFYCKGISKTEN